MTDKMDQILADRHLPIFHVDLYEQQKLVNLNKYVTDKTILNDDTLCCYIRRDNDRTFIYYFAFYLRDDGIDYYVEHNVGGHAYDMEQMIVELSGNIVVAVNYFPHGSLEHFKITGTDLTTILDNNRPIAYSSRGKHGFYPISGRIFRYFGIANDICKPILVPVKAELATSYLLSQDTIDSQFAAIKTRIAQNLEIVPKIELRKVKTHMAFVIPTTVRSAAIQNRSTILSTLLLIVVIFIIIKEI